MLLETVCSDCTPAGIHLHGKFFTWCIFKGSGRKVIAAVIFVVIKLFDRPVLILALSLGNDKSFRIQLLVRIDPDPNVVPPDWMLFRRSGCYAFILRLLFWLFRLRYSRLLFRHFLFSKLCILIGEFTGAIDFPVYACNTEHGPVVSTVIRSFGWILLQILTPQIF